jgi:hypothetical protein
MAIERRFYLLNVVEEIEIGCRGGYDEREQENGDGEGAVEGHAPALLMFRCSVGVSPRLLPKTEYLFFYLVSYQFSDYLYFACNSNRTT